MKKIFGLLLVIVVIGLTGCNYEGYDFLDTNYHFNRAIMKMPDGSVKEIEVEKWADAEDGEQITITAKDGTRYLIHSANVILIEDKELRNDR